MLSDSKNDGCIDLLHINSSLLGLSEEVSTKVKESQLILAKEQEYESDISDEIYDVDAISDDESEQDDNS